MLEKLEEKFTKYELARIIGARALQIAMDAPLLLKIDDKELEEINYNPIEIAQRELAAGVLPITVNKPMPKKKDSKIKKLSKEELEAMKKKTEIVEEDKDKKSKETAEVKKVDDAVEVETTEKAEDDHEIMELASPEDESEDSGSSGEEEGV